MTFSEVFKWSNGLKWVKERHMRVLFGIQEYEDFFSEPNLLQVPLVLWFCEHLENIVLENRELSKPRTCGKFYLAFAGFFFQATSLFQGNRFRGLLAARTTSILKLSENNTPRLGIPELLNHVSGLTRIELSLDRTQSVSQSAAVLKLAH